MRMHDEHVDDLSLHTSGLTITFSSCTVKVSASAHAYMYVYPAIVKFYLDIGLHKIIMNIENHIAVNVAFLTICSNGRQVRQWLSSLHSSVGTTSPLFLLHYKKPP